MSGSPDACAAPAFDVALTQYLQHLEHFRQCSPHTLTAYRTDARSFLAWAARAEPALRLSDLDQSILLRYLADQRGLSANTLRRRIHALRGWFTFMVRQGLLQSNPTDGLTLPKRKRAVLQYPSPEQVDRLLSAAGTPLEHAVIWLLAGTGLRRAELLSLDITDLAPDLTELRVVGKGDKERRVPVPTTVRDVLSAYLAARGDGPGALLLNRAAHRLGSTSLRRLFLRLAKRAGLEDCGFSLHSMRHAYATMLVQAGVDLGTVRDLLGHSDVAVTSVYVHSDLRSRKDAVEHLPLGKPRGGHHGQATE